MVTNVDSETGDLAEVGVVLYLDTLKEVSEQTQDRVKYIGQHRVIDRVRLKKVRSRDMVPAPGIGAGAGALLMRATGPTRPPKPSLTTASAPRAGAQPVGGSDAENLPQG